MRLSKTSIVAVPLAALAISGCGGGGGDTTASTQATETTPALSKAELISQGDAICAEVNAAAGAAEIVAAEGEEAELKAKVSGLYIGMVESIKRLGSPDDATGYAEFSAAADELSTVEGEVKLAAEREDTAALDEAATAATAAREEFESVAGEYGFEDCSEGPNAPTATGTGTAPVEESEEGGVEVAPEEIEEEVVPEEVAPEEVAPETGGAGGGVEEAAPEAGGGSSGGSSGGVGPG
ncbi:MAG TPA: hypothetical protein VH275_07095 [Solirubrobacterales bacterium]|jgi:hypothetical protein|nr:hypothetical protein [Solirubrobacterales bacterium]